MHGIVLMVHVVGWSMVTRRRLLLVFLYPILVLAPAAEEKSRDADQEQESKGDAYCNAGYGTSRQGIVARRVGGA